MEWTTLLRYLQALKDRRPSVLEAKKPLPRVWSWMVRILCSAVIIAIGVTLCIRVTNYLPRGPKSGGQEILLLSRTKHSTKKNQPTIMEFLSPFSGFGCRSLFFCCHLLSFPEFPSVGFPQGHDLGIFWCLQYQAQRGGVFSWNFLGSGSKIWKYGTNYHRNLPIFKLGGSSFFQVFWGWKELVNHAADELDDGLPHFADVQDGFARYTRGTSCNRYSSIKTCAKGCQATLWNQIFFLECNAVVLHLLGPQWFWTHIYETLLVHFPASLYQLGIGKFQCSSRRDFPLECRPFKSYTVSSIGHRRCLHTWQWRRRPATSTWEPKISLWKNSGKVGKTGDFFFEKKIVVRL